MFKYVLMWGTDVLAINSALQFASAAPWKCRL